MSKKIEFYFDFGSPTSYLAYNRLKQVNDKYGVDFELKPVLLGGLFKATSNNSPAVVMPKAIWMDIDMNRYAQRFNIKFKQNPFFPINTMMLMRGALVAKEINCFENYVETIYNAMWKEPKNLADITILSDVLSKAGLNAEAIMEGVQQVTIKDELKSLTSAAVDRGLFGCPTMFYDGEFFFGQDRIFFIEELIEDERAQQQKLTN